MATSALFISQMGPAHYLSVFSVKLRHPVFSGFVAWYPYAIRKGKRMKDPKNAKSSLQYEVLGMPFATNSHPMWIYDLKTLAFLKVNEAAIRVYGFSEKDFERMTVLDIRPSKDVERFLRSWNHPHESTAENWWHVGKNGTPFPVSITSWKLSFGGREAEMVLARRVVALPSVLGPNR
jgi:hypothetical protein